ncbi:MAG: hypothetical protein VYE73_08130 [Acidobacteriota bacterium]|nr:hypothetical protein [Acidobacteriota bacterium]
MVVDSARWLVDTAGTSRASVIALLGLSGLVVSTWKQLVHGLYIGMSGRAWLVRGSVFATLALLTLIVALFPWVIRNPVPLCNALPWILAAMVLLKIVAAAWISARLYASRLLSDRTLVVGALAWSVAALGLYGLLLWLAPTLGFIRHLLALVAILAIPLARLSAAPLALSWSRHR